MQAPRVSQIERYFDQDGRLTPEGMKLFVALLSMLQDHDDRLAGGGL